MKFITVDIGSTFIKAGVFDVLLKRQLEQKKYHTPARKDHPDGAYYENDAEEFVQIVKRLIHDCCSRYPDAAGLLCSTQQHGCVICHPELPGDTYISWQDTRCLKIRPESGKSYLQELRELFTREDMRANGVYIKPALALCNLYALFDGQKLKRNVETRVYTLGAYIIEKLTGNNICHITNAAPMGFADVLDNTWRYDMLERIGLGFFRLPAITSRMECCGYYEDGAVRLAVFPDVGDVQTCVYGTSAAAGDLVINIGTSGQLIYVTDEYIPGEYEIRPFYDNNFCNVISSMPGGRNFDVQIDYIRDIGEKIFGVRLERGEIWDRIGHMKKDRDAGGLAVDCGFYELPDRLADGSIRHINHENLKLSNVMWATAVDFGKKYKKYADYLWGQDRKKGTVYFAGGALLKNQELQEAIRQELGVGKVVCAPEDEVFKGMERLVLQCAERMESDETGDKRRAGAAGGFSVGDCSTKFTAADAGIGA